MLDIGPVHHLTMPAAAHAIGADARTVRGWIESGALPLLVPRQEANKWLRIPPADVLRLAVLGHMTRYGFTFAEAGAIVTKHIDPRLSGVVLAAGDITWHLLRNRLLGLALQVSREPDGRVAVSATCMRGARPATHTAATLTVNVHAALEDIHKRADERGGNDV